MNKILKFWVLALFFLGFAISSAWCPLSQDEEALLAAAQKGDVKTVKALLAGGVSVFTADERYGRTALHDAASEGHVEVVKVLLGNDPQTRLKIVNQGTLHNTSALHFAVAYVDVVRVLLTANAIVDAVDRIPQNTALHLAALQGMSDVVEVLLAAGANANAENTQFSTVLSFALQWENEAIVHILLDHGVNQRSLDFVPEEYRLCLERIRQQAKDYPNQCRAFLLCLNRTGLPWAHELCGIVDSCVVGRSWAKTKAGLTSMGLFDKRQLDREQEEKQA